MGRPPGVATIVPQKDFDVARKLLNKTFFEKIADVFACGSSFGPSWPSRWAQDGPGDPKGSQLGQDIGFGYPLGCRL